MEGWNLVDGTPPSPVNEPPLGPAAPPPPTSTSTGQHGAGDATLAELIGANVVGELEGIARDLDKTHTLLCLTEPGTQFLLRRDLAAQIRRLAKIAAGIRKVMGES